MFEYFGFKSSGLNLTYPKQTCSIVMGWGSSPTTASFTEEEKRVLNKSSNRFDFSTKKLLQIGIAMDKL